MNEVNRMEFRYYLPVNMIFGRGKLAEIGKVTAKHGSHALIVTGGSSTKKSGVLDRVRNSLLSERIESVVFDKVRPNPLTETVELGAAFVRENRCDVIVAVGGGSVIDCAKGIAFIAKNGRDINDYIYNRYQGRGALPLIAVPTTCGTGSEGNGFAVLTNPETGDKKSLRRDGIIPAVSLIDSELMETMPKSILAAVGFDALCHCMEAYLSNASQPMTDMLSLEGMKLISDNLVNVYNGYNDPAAWDALAWASTMGGMVIHSAGVGLPHAMEHPVSGFNNVTHGRGLAALVPVITEASADYAPEKYGVISKLLRGKTAADCADAVRSYLEKLDLKVSLSGEGVTRKDIPKLTENCFKVSAASIANHPAAFTSDMIAKLYERAL